MYFNKSVKRVGKNVYDGSISCETRIANGNLVKLNKVRQQKNKISLEKLNVFVFTYYWKVRVL